MTIKNITKTKAFLVSVTATVAAFTIAAITSVEADPSKRGHRPPQEAIEACIEKASGDDCVFTHREHNVEGECFSPSDDKPLACRPNRPPGPPAEAVDACVDKTIGDGCNFQHHDNHVDGACRLSPKGEEPLACAPDGPPHHRK